METLPLVVLISVITAYLGSFVEITDFPNKVLGFTATAIFELLFRTLPIMALPSAVLLGEVEVRPKPMVIFLFAITIVLHVKPFVWDKS